MATPLDLQEQEQIEDLKAFWKNYGNLITWVVVLALGAFAAFNGWNAWQRSQAAKASGLFEQLERAVQSGDIERTGRVFADLKDRFPGTAYAEQGALAAAKLQHEKGRAEEARATLAWAAENASQDEYRTIARVRLAGLLMDAKQFDEALKQLDAAGAQPFQALVADRRGDVLLAQGKKEEARAAYQAAWQAMDPGLEYRRLLEAKLTALGAAPGAAGAAQ